MILKDIKIWKIWKIWVVKCHQLSHNIEMLCEACNCLSISKCCVGSPANSLVKGSHCSTDLRQEKVLNRKRNCFGDPKHPGRDKGRGVLQFSNVTWKQLQWQAPFWDPVSSNSWTMLFCAITDLPKQLLEQIQLPSAICWLHGCTLTGLHTGINDGGTMPRKEAMGFHGCQNSKPNCSR